MLPWQETHVCREPLCVTRGLQHTQTWGPQDGLCMRKGDLCSPQILLLLFWHLLHSAETTGKEILQMFFLLTIFYASSYREKKMVNH